MEKTNLSVIIPGMPEVIICNRGPRTPEEFKKLGIKVAPRKYQNDGVVKARIEKFLRAVEAQG